MEDTNLNKINVDDDEEEEEVTFCPYKKVKNMFGGFFGGGNQSKNSTNENPKLSTEDNEQPKCPFGFTSSKKSAPKGKCPFGFGAQDTTADDDKPKCPFGFTSSKKTTQGKCPFGFGAHDDNNAEKTFNDFYYFGEFNDKGIIDGKGIKIFNKNYLYCIS